MDLCRRVIRQNITKERIEQGKIDELNLPTTIKDYLAYKDRRQNQLVSLASSWNASKLKTKKLFWDFLATQPLPVWISECLLETHGIGLPV